MAMISWRMTGPKRPMERVETPLPDPGPGEVLVRVAGCGVCHTDLGFLFDGVPIRSVLPLTLGHEISGIVEKAGSGARQCENKGVIIPAVIPCGKCDPCRRGIGNICAAQKMPGNDIQGGFASHIVVPAESLCEVPLSAEGRPLGQSGVSLAELSVVADALTTPYQAIVDAGLTAEDSAIFIGAGGVGGFGAQIAKAHGAAVAAVDIDQEKLDRLSPFVDGTFNAGRMPFKDLRKAISDLIKAQGRRRTEWKIFEASGTAAGQKTAFGLMTYGAHLSIIGFTLETVDIRLSNLMAFHATAHGNWGCLPGHYPKVLDLVLSGRVKIGPFVKPYPLAEINEVFEMVHSKKIGQRPVLIP